MELKSALNAFEATWKIHSPNDWYKASAPCLRSLRGQFDTKVHGGVTGLLAQAYPAHTWQPEKFQNLRVTWDKATQEKFMTNLGSQLGFTKMEDWYTISGKDFTDYDGGSLLNIYSSPAVAVMGIFKDHTWIPWKFRNVPNSTWEEEGSFRKFAEYLAEQKEFKTKEDWYKVSWADVQACGGKAMVYKHFDAVLWKFVTKCFPEYNLKPWLFENCSKGVWDDVQVRREYMQYLGEKLNIKNMADWYKVSAKDFSENDGDGLLSVYDRSVGQTIVGILCEHQWEIWRFPSPNIRDNRATMVNYMKYLGDKLGFTEMEDWYRVRAQDFYDNAGAPLVHRYKHLSALVSAAFPDHAWLPWKFTNIKRLWDEKEIRVKFMTQLAEKLNYTTPDDWYQLTQDDLRKHGGTSLLKFYNGSPSAVVAATFPEKDWVAYRFKAIPKRIKNQIGESALVRPPVPANSGNTPVVENPPPTPLLSSLAELPPSGIGENENSRELRKAFAHLETQLGITRVDDWYRVSADQIQKHVRATRTYIERMGLPALLRMVYPRHPWDDSKFPPSYFKLSKQRMMKVLLAKYLLPKGTLLLENHSHNALYFEKTPITSDLFIPSLNLSLEYQGKQHYQSIDLFGDAGMRSDYDEEKKRQLEKLGITVVSIPYWWDGKPELLIERIQKSKPEIQFSYKKTTTKTGLQREEEQESAGNSVT
eukprot:Phypoly_transcript_04232.p1 GENE.Phypoly_transcript_04232~~Phypoly_transcript_04232.p1  ORF type:complete len:701 (+),score=132.74 Phypoly_transcript_04232:83-2185(+)